MTSNHSRAFPKSRAGTSQLEIGTEKIFNVLNPVADGTIGWQPRTFRLADREMDLYYLWVATDETNMIGPAEVATIRKALVDETPAGSIRPDHGMLVNDQSVFGQPPDYDGDHHTDIILYDIRDPSIGGFVTLEDVDPSAAPGVGNQADVLYIDSPRLVPGQLPVIAHEYVHLLNISSGLDLNYTFNTEGFAEYAIVMNGFPFWRGIRYLPFQSDNGSGQDEFEYTRALFSWRTDEPGARDPYLFDYQRANLFFGYVGDQFGAPAVGDMLKSARKGPDAVAAVLTARGSSLPEVIEDFHTANFANKRTPNAHYGYPLYGRPVSDAPPTRIYDGEDTANGWEGPEYITIINDESIRSGAVKYLRWDGVADFSIAFDIYGAHLFSAETVSLRRAHLVGRLIAERQDATMEYIELEAGRSAVKLPGPWRSVVLQAADTAPQIPDGERFSISAAWTPLSRLATATADPVEAVRQISLGQNFPNPLFGQAVIPFELSRPDRVRLSVYDVLGRLVDVVVDHVFTAGRHEEVFDAGGLPVGVYFYRLETDGQVRVRAMNVAMRDP